MTISEIYCDAMDAIHDISNRYWDKKITLEEARAEQEAVMDQYDERVNRMRSAEIAKHEHDFAMP